MRFKILPIVVALVLSAASAFAQTPADVASPPPLTTRLAWDHDGLNTEGFRIYSDNVRVGADLPVSARETPFPALTPGVHVLKVRAFNGSLESADSNLVTVRILVVPQGPSNFHIIIARLDPSVGWVPMLQAFTPAA